MATKTKKVYNLNEMREALLKAHKNGNSRLINGQDALTSGVSDGFFKLYLGRVDELHKAIETYVRTKHANSKQIAEYGGIDEWRELLSQLRNDIFPKWKELLECGEKTKTAKSLHVIPEDIDSLVGYAEMFLATANTPLNSDETVYAPLAIAVVPVNRFRKKVETLLGIRIAEAEVLSNDERDFLLDEKRLINQIKSRKRKIQELNDRIENLKKFKKLIKDNKEIANINAEIEKTQAIVNGKPEQGDNLETKLAKAKSELKQLYTNKGISIDGLDLD